jgi:hypothetical protein
MFDLKMKNIKSQTSKPQLDDVTFDDVVDTFDTFQKLSSIIEGVFNAEELNAKTFDDVLSVLKDGYDEVNQDSIDFLAGRLLDYVGLSESAYEDLTSDSVEVATIELDNLSDLIATRMDGSTLNEFVAFALANPSLDDVEVGEDGSVSLDGVTLDWSFHPTRNECKKEMMGTDPDTGKKYTLKDKKMKCMQGFKGRQKGFWRYPDNGTSGRVGMDKYKRRLTKPTAWDRDHPQATKKRVVNLNKAKSRKHSSQADLKRTQAQTQRDKAGMKTFAGYDPDGQVNE